MKGLHGIIFSYEKQQQPAGANRHRMPASVPFAGRYRIIRFVLSSMSTAGIPTWAWVSTGTIRAFGPPGLRQGLGI